MQEHLLSRFREPQILTTGHELFPVLEEIVRNAQSEILVSNYWWASDPGACKFLEALSEAARRGVRVRAIIDEFGSRHTGHTVKEVLERDGVRVRMFRHDILRWLLRHPLALMCRNHTRIVLVDRKLFGIGGICFGDISLDRQDLFMLHCLYDTVPIIRCFERLWELAITPRSKDPLLGEHNSLGAATPYTLLTSGPQKADQILYAWIENACKNASRRVSIATPFFFPEKALLHVLQAACRRRVAVEMVTPLRTDKPRYDRFRTSPIPRLLAHGARWYATPTYFHSKLCIIDDRWTFGSANFDIISTKRNYDLNVCGTGGAVLAALEQHLAILKQGAQDITAYPSPFIMKALSTIFYPFAEFFFKLT